MTSSIAGSDITATALRGCLFAIITSPRVYRKLVKEIDSAIAQGRLSSPVEESEAQTLPYLQAAILEGLRRFSPITQLQERVVLVGGENSWGIQLNPIFGQDLEVFRPERWLIEDQEKLQQMSHVFDLIFGWDTTRCLGILIALMNLNKIFIELFRRYQ